MSHNWKSVMWSRSASTIIYGNTVFDPRAAEFDEVSYSDVFAELSTQPDIYDIETAYLQPHKARHV